MDTLNNVFSPQTKKVYQLLRDSAPMSAQQIASCLDILPNAVYRVAKKLMDLGLVEQIDSYPVKYKAVPMQMAVSIYQIAAIQSFKREFGLLRQPGLTKSESPKISLIKDRAGLLRRGDIDVKAARKTIDFIVSGHEVPDETILAYRKAAVLGAKIRMIIHQKPQIHNPYNKIWKEIGAQVRYLPEFKMRMLIFDKRVVHLTSFDPRNYKSAFGVRFEYEPLAIMLSDVFDQHWQKAKELN